MMEENLELIAKTNALKVQMLSVHNHPNQPLLVATHI